MLLFGLFVLPQLIFCVFYAEINTKQRKRRVKRIDRGSNDTGANSVYSKFWYASRHSYRLSMYYLPRTTCFQSRCHCQLRFCREKNQWVYGDMITGCDPCKHGALYFGKEL